jgi:uncharacterized membrane protein
MGNFFEALERTSWVMTIAETGWLYAAISVTHYFTLFVLVGTIVLVDLRILGVAARSQSVTQLAETLFPWTWTALGLALLSGFLMFTTDGGDYYPDRVFRIKMGVILVALIFAVIVRLNFRKWDQSPVMSAWAKLAACLSILFWVGDILAGVEIAAISGLG